MQGHATVTGTKRFQDKLLTTVNHCNHTIGSPFQTIPRFSELPKRGWLLSSIGLGGYRIAHGFKGSQAAMHDHQGYQAARQALLSGVNVLDTSAHFGGGKSEELFGAVLKDLVKTNQLQRDEVVVVSKCGFVLDSASQTLATGHSISPDFIEKELSSSLNRLGLETIDIYMLNNPERALRRAEKPLSMPALLAQLASAFEHLEKELDRGRISGYGISSSAFEELLPRLKEQDSYHSKNFLAVEYPLNLFERSAAFSEDPIIQSFEKAGLYQLTQRPFNAISNQSVRYLGDKLGSESTDMITKALMAQFEYVTDLEVKLTEILGGEASDVAHISKFIWGQALAENLPQLTTSPMLASHYFKTTVEYSVKADLQSLQDYIKQQANSAFQESGEQTSSSLVEDIWEWSQSYHQGVHSLGELVHKLSQTVERDENEKLAQVLNALIPSGQLITSSFNDVEESSSSSSSSPLPPLSTDNATKKKNNNNNVLLSDISLRFAQSALLHGTNGRGGTVLVGMTRPEWVSKILNDMRQSSQRQQAMSRQELQDLDWSSLLDGE